MDGSVQQLVTASDVERFWRDGVLCLRDLFVGWIDPMRAAIEEALAAPGPLAQDPAREGYDAARHERVRSFHIELGLWSRHPTFRAFALESPAADIAASLMTGSAVNLFFDQLFVKEPGSPEQVTPWHQDQAYWPIRGDQVVSIWVPFDRVTQARGALRYVAGSHRWGVHFGPRDFGREQRMLKGIGGDAVPDVDAHPDRYEVLTWELEPGDCLVHHGMTLHGAAGNASGSVRRRAHSIRFTGDDVRWDPRPGILDRIPRMTTSPLSLQAGDALTCDAFPIVRTPLRPRASLS